MPGYKHMNIQSVGWQKGSDEKDLIIVFSLIPQTDRDGFMLSSGSAASISHCIMLRFVLHQKYAEPGEKGRILLLQ